MPPLLTSKEVKDRNCFEALIHSHMIPKVIHWLLIQIFLRIHWSLWAILKTSKKVYKVRFFDMEKFLYSKSYSIHYTLRYNTNVKKICFRHDKRYKKCPLFSLRFLYEVKHKVRLSKTIRGFFHVRFRHVFIKVYIFVQQNAWTLWL